MIASTEFWLLGTPFPQPGAPAAPGLVPSMGAVVDIRPQATLARELRPAVGSVSGDPVPTADELRPAGNGVRDLRPAARTARNLRPRVRKVEEE